jgi:FAD/FMN-containing dehydrogenase
LSEIFNFDGEVFTHDHPHFAEVIETHSSHGVAPAYLVRPTSTADVAAAIAFAEERGLTLAVRSGGHTAYSSIEDGLVIDMANFNSIEVLDGGRVRIATAARWGEVALALRPHNLAISSGDNIKVGVGGLTLGGGIGWMVRQYGLTIDSLLEAEVVLVSGEVVTASPTSHPDLFWAIRGGGGNFGVITHFTYQAQYVEGVVSGTINLDATDLAAALSGLRDVMSNAPEKLNATLMARPAVGDVMPASIVIVFCYGGPDSPEARDAIAPLLALPTVVSHDYAPKSYAEVLTDEHLPVGLRIVDNNSFADELSDELIEKIVAMNKAADMSVLMIRWIQGAVNRVSAEATSVGYRNASLLIVAAVLFPGDTPDEATAPVAERWEWLTPYTNGMYGNWAFDKREGMLNRIYPPATLARLRSIKSVYDPKNLLSVNHNIVPA